jgi:hypothetical protein
MIPDSRISRIRFEAVAYTLRLPTGRGQFKSMVDIHSLSLRFTHSLASRRVCRFLPTPRSAPVPINSHHVPRGPLLQKRYLPSLLLRPQVPVPKPLTNFAFTLAGQSLQLGPSAAGLQNLPDVTSAIPSLDAWTLTPAASGVLLPVSSPRASAFPETVAGRRSAGTRATTSARTVISELQSFLYVQASRFASHPGRSHRCLFRHGSRDFYFRAPYELLPPHTSDMLAVRFRAIDGSGLAPHKIRSVVGRIHRF